jgi:hypothetical protein
VERLAKTQSSKDFLIAGACSLTRFIADCLAAISFCLSHSEHSGLGFAFTSSFNVHIGQKIG